MVGWGRGLLIEGFKRLVGGRNTQSSGHRDEEVPREEPEEKHPWLCAPGPRPSRLWLGNHGSSTIRLVIGLPRWLDGKESACQCGTYKRLSLGPRVRKTPWRRKWQPTPVFLSGEVHGQGSYSPWGRKESDTTEQLSMCPRVGMKIHQVKAQHRLCQNVNSRSWDNVVKN